MCRLVLGGAALRVYTLVLFIPPAIVSQRIHFRYIRQLKIWSMMCWSAVAMGMEHSNVTQELPVLQETCRLGNFMIRQLHTWPELMHLLWFWWQLFLRQNMLFFAFCSKYCWHSLKSGGQFISWQTYHRHPRSNSKWSSHYYWTEKTKILVGLDHEGPSQAKAHTVGGTDEVGASRHNQGSFSSNGHLSTYWVVWCHAVWTPPGMRQNLQGNGLQHCYTESCGNAVLLQDFQIRE